MIAQSRRVARWRAEPAAFKAHLATLRQREWVIYVKRPFGRPDAALAYLSRAPHRYRQPPARRLRRRTRDFQMEGLPGQGDARYKLKTLDADEFIRRFLIHVLPDGFHRIRR